MSYLKITMLWTLLLMSVCTNSLFAQNTLKMGSTGPAGSGPTTSPQTVTLFKNGTIPYTPTLTVTYAVSNQQYPTVVNDNSKPGLTIGGSSNSFSDNPMGTFPIYTNMNGISSPLNNMFSGCLACGADNGIDVTTDKAVSLYLASAALIDNNTNNNLVPTNSRVYFGDLTISFNRPVNDPVLQIVGMGGFVQYTVDNKVYFQGFSGEMDLITSGVTLGRLDGNHALTVTSNQIKNNKTWLGSNSQGETIYGVTRYAASGSVVAYGTGITSITFKVYLRGDGGRISDLNGYGVPGDFGRVPVWSLSNIAALSNNGILAGDVFLVGASVEEPYENCSNNNDDDWDGLIDCADPDCGAVNISSVNVGACVNHAFADVATLDVTLSWGSGSPNQKIEVKIAGKSRFIDVPSGVTSPKTVRFQIPADGSTGNSITANFVGFACQSSSTYNAPPPCSNDRLNCSVLYLCGDAKGADSDAFDHGLMQYIDGFNGNAALVGAITKNVSGLGLFDPYTGTTPLNLNIDTFKIIIVSSSTNSRISADLKLALKNTPANVLLLEHGQLLDLAMASYQGYNPQDYAVKNNPPTQMQLYDFNNNDPWPFYPPYIGLGNYHTNANVILWKNISDITDGVRGVFFSYSKNTILSGVPSTRGVRTFLGYFEDNVYANSANGGLMPVPQADWFDPIRHLTEAGKYYLDEAIKSVAQSCNIEDCSNGIDDDGDGLIDCDDTDCQATAPANIIKN